MLASIVLALHPMPPHYAEPLTALYFGAIAAVLWFPVVGLMWQSAIDREERWRLERGIR